jgi:two-component system OmpR family response regulator
MAADVTANATFSTIGIPILLGATQTPIERRCAGGGAEGIGRRGGGMWQKDGFRSVPGGGRTSPVYSRREVPNHPRMSRRIAIVEDDAAIRENVADTLRRQGYEIAAHADRAQALAAFQGRLPDLAIVDIGLGADVDGGFTLVRELRAMSAELPIIFLTARDSDFDLVAGLRLGADDYLTKSISMPHLLARIAALFRRMDVLRSPSKSEETLDRGLLRLDLKRMTAAWRDQAVDLTLTEFWMVHALAKYPGHVKNRDSLMSDANLVVDDATVTSHIKRIRKKFVAVDPAFDAIDTVYGMGYRWVSA